MESVCSIPDSSDSPLSPERVDDSPSSGLVMTPLMKIDSGSRMHIVSEIELAKTLAKWQYNLDG